MKPISEVETLKYFLDKEKQWVVVEKKSIEVTNDLKEIDFLMHWRQISTGKQGFYVSLKQQLNPKSGNRVSKHM